MYSEAVWHKMGGIRESDAERGTGKPCGLRSAQAAAVDHILDDSEVQECQSVREKERERERQRERESQRDWHHEKSASKAISVPPAGPG